MEPAASINNSITLVNRYQLVLAHKHYGIGISLKTIKPKKLSQQIKTRRSGFGMKGNAGAKVLEAADRLSNSGRHMQALLDDLLDFNRTKLGLGISISPRDVDLGQLVRAN